MISRKNWHESAWLDVFVDASIYGFAAVTYFLWAEGDAEIGIKQSSQVFAKTRVAPIKKAETVARLELCAAQLGIMVASKVCFAFQMPPDSVRYWTDSSTVLWWLHTDKALPVYLANRVCCVLEGSHPNQWYHVSMLVNPADLPSRGANLDNFIQSDLWWRGPIFLCQDQERWLPQPECKPTNKALREVISMENLVRRYALLSVSRPRGSPLADLL